MTFTGRQSSRAAGGRTHRANRFDPSSVTSMLAVQSQDKLNELVCPMENGVPGKYIGEGIRGPLRCLRGVSEYVTKQPIVFVRVGRRVHAFRAEPLREQSRVIHQLRNPHAAKLYARSFSSVGSAIWNGTWRFTPTFARA